MGRETFVKSSIKSGAVTIAAGYSGFTLVVKDDGTLWATGINNWGQLGDGTKTNRYTFVKVMDSGVKDVVSRVSCTFALKTDGSVWATGYNRFYAQGDGSSRTRTSFAQVFSSGVKAISTGAQHTQLLMQDGSVWAAGSNVAGELGGDMEQKRDSRRKTTTFKKVVDGGVKQVVAGSGMSALLNDKGELCVTGTGASLGIPDLPREAYIKKNVLIFGFDKKCFPPPGAKVAP